MSHFFDLVKFNINNIKKRRKIFYFIGNLDEHLCHLIFLYKKIGGTVIVLSKKTKKICKQQGLKTIMLDNYEEAFIDLNTNKISKTINFLEKQNGYLFFFDAFKNFKINNNKLKKIMLFHGNSLKTFWFNEWRVDLLKKEFDFISGLGPFLKKHMIKKGINKNKIINTGQARTDFIILNKNNKNNLLKRKLKIKDKIIVSYLPTWFNYEMLSFFGEKIINNIPSKYILLFRPHPATPKELIEKLLSKRKTNVIFLPDKNKYNISYMNILLGSDMFIMDFSSVLFDVMLLSKPIIFTYYKKYLPNKLFTPIRELFKNCQKISEKNYKEIEKILSKAYTKKIKNDEINNTRKRLFFDLNGYSVSTLIKSID